MKTLVAFSGGIDSIYVLWNELSKTNNAVTAVFYTGEKITSEMRQNFNVLNVEEKMFADARFGQIQEMSEKIMKATRQFDVIKEAIEPELLDTDTSNPLLLNHAATLRTAMAVKHINVGTYDSFLTGVSKDNDGYLIKKNGYKNDESASSLSMKYFLKHAKRGELRMPLCDMDYTVAQALNELPEWLIAINRSCQFSLSSKINACNECYKCMTHEYARNLLAKGKTTEEIYDLYMQKSILPNGEWRSQQIWIAEEVPCNITSDITSYKMPEWGNSCKILE